MSGSVAGSPAFRATHALQPAALLFGGAEVTGRIATATDSVEVGDPALAHGGLPLRIGLHDVFDTFGFIGDQNGFDAFDFFPRSKIPAGNIDDGFECPAALLDDRQRFTADR